MTESKSVLKRHAVQNGLPVPDLAQIKMREDFEVWRVKKVVDEDVRGHYLRKDADGNYTNRFSQARWEAWQAAIAQQAIKS